MEVVLIRPRGIDLPYVVLIRFRGIDLPYVVLIHFCGICLPYVVLIRLYGIDLPYVVLICLCGIDLPDVVLKRFYGIDLSYVILKYKLRTWMEEEEDEDQVDGRSKCAKFESGLKPKLKMFGHQEIFDFPTLVNKCRMFEDDMRMDDVAINKPNP
ncbi:hypothetical protein Lal_00039239 [Lupinus albus]|nr:hypothetical protein Lal_00039239 [Lupinus albus]